MRKVRSENTKDNSVKNTQSHNQSELVFGVLISIRCLSVKRANLAIQVISINTTKFQLSVLMFKSDNPLLSGGGLNSSQLCQETMELSFLGGKETLTWLVTNDRKECL